MKSEQTKALALGAELPGFAQFEWAEGRKPSSKKAWLVVGLWRPEFDGNEGLFERLAEVQSEHGEKVPVCAVSPGELDALEGLELPEGVLQAVCTEEHFAALDPLHRNAGHSFLLDAKRIVRWWGNVTNVKRVLELLLEGALSEKKLRVLAETTERALLAETRFFDHRIENLALKAQLREDLTALLETFEGDDFLLGTLGSASRPDVGESAPPLGKIQWVRAPKGKLQGRRLVVVCDHNQLEGVEVLELLEDLHARFARSLSVLCLDANSEESTKEWLEGEQTQGKCPVGLAGEELAQGFFPPDAGGVGEQAFLLDAEDKILWHGSAEAMTPIVEHLLERGATEATLREHCLARERFEVLLGRLDLEAPVEEEDFRALEAEASAVLDFNPAELDVFASTLKAAQSQGPEVAERWARRVDLARCSEQRLRTLLVEASVGASVLYESAVRWGYELVRRIPEEAHGFHLFAEAAAAVRLTELALEMHRRSDARTPAESVDGGSVRELENRVRGLRAAEKLFPVSEEA